MPLPVKYRPQVVAEVEEAFDWYADRSIEAAERFRAELNLGIQAIRREPNRWPRYIGQTRRFRLKDFPYLIVFRPTENSIEVLAVAHTSRSPGYWKQR